MSNRVYLQICSVFLQAVTLSVLCTNNIGIFFEETLLKLIRRGADNALSRLTRKIWSILQGANNTNDSNDSSGKTLLHFAAEYGNHELARHLIDLGAEVDAQDQMKETPLMFALNAHYNAETVKVLLEAGADIFATDVNGRCALQKAAALDHSRRLSVLTLILMPLLISKVTLDSLKASKYAASDAFHRDYPLYHFMQLNDVNVTRFLLEAGSPINAKHSFIGETALKLAVELNSLENVKLLLEYGANVEVKDVLCVLRSHWDEQSTPAIMKLLIDRSGVLNDSASRRQEMTSVLLMHGNRGIVRTLLQYPIDLQSQLEPHGLTPLHYLCLNHKPNVLEELRDFDFDVDIRDGIGSTLLHYAATMGNASSIQYLADRGVDVNSKNLYTMKTPLSTIVDSFIERTEHFQCPGDYVHALEILLLYGADPNICKEKKQFDSLYHDITNMPDEFIAPIFAKLALLEACGQSIDIVTRNRIESEPKLKSEFDAIKLQLEEMKQIEIVPSFTLFHFMITHNISRFARNECFVSNLTDVMKNCSTLPYYHRVLQRRFSKFSELIDLRETLLPVINEVLSEFSDLSLYNIAEQIVACLVDEQWKEIL